MKVEYKDVYLLYPNELKIDNNIDKSEKEEKTVSLSLEQIEERLKETQSLHI